MNKTGHLAVGFIVGIVFLLVMNKTLGWFDILNYKAWVIYVAIFFIYALLADVDHKMSTITWTFLGLGVLGMAISFYLDHRLLMISSAFLIGLTYVAAQWFPHRGPTHTIWFAALTCVPVYVIIGWQEAILAFLVYYSHLAADGEWFKINI